MDCTDIVGVQRTHVASFIAQLSELGLEPKSLNRKLSAVQSFFEWAIRNGLVETNPARNVKRPKAGSSLPSVVRIESIEKLFREIDFPSGFVGVRDRLIMSVLYACGLRRQELIELRLSSVSKSDRSLRVIGKRNKERLVPLSGDLINEIEVYEDLRGELESDADHLFLTEKGKKLYPSLVYKIVKSYLSQVTPMEKRSPHVLRHTFATHLLNEGANLQAIKELLGHSSLASTQVYTHTSLDKLKDVYRKSHPRNKKS
ncbi:MAG: tyrosine recombinase XerC [Salibacteraceae bacterium]